MAYGAVKSGELVRDPSALRLLDYENELADLRIQDYYRAE
jgi:hypothetical protein